MIYLDYEETRLRTSLVRVIGDDGLELKRSGKELTCLCPFHDDHHPSMRVNPDKGVFYCPVCLDGGDVIEYVRKRQGYPKTSDGRNQAAIWLDNTYLSGELQRSSGKKREGIKADEIRKRKLEEQRAVFNLGVDKLLSIANTKPEDEGDKLRAYANGLVFDENNPDEIRAAIVIYGTPEDVAELDEIQPATEANIIPTDFSDTAEGRIFAGHYSDRALITQEFGWLFFDGVKWRPSDNEVRELMHELTDRQLDEARRQLVKAAEAVADAATGTEEERRKAEAAEKKAKAFQKFVTDQRGTRHINGALIEAATTLEVPGRLFDSKPYLLNTPAGTYDLETGELKEHDAGDYLTACTEYSPNDEGREIWDAFINRITEGDTEYSEFLQRVCGMSIVGEVLDEKLIICNGTGGNGKSTLFNALTIALGGGYAVPIASSVLISQEGQSKRFELAKLRGKRLVTAAETKTGECLDESLIKTMTSTNEISGEIKYKSPFTFKPSHHLILQTNHLPKVEGLDDGIWDRLLVLPFTARLRNTDNEIKNYSEYLAHHCGGAIVQWLIEGAQRYLKDRKLTRIPEVVRTATEDYRDEYDVLYRWRVLKCETGGGLMARAADLYESFNAYAKENGKESVNKTAFGNMMRKAGYQSRKIRGTMHYRDISVKD